MGRRESESDAVNPLDSGINQDLAPSIEYLNAFPRLSISLNSSTQLIKTTPDQPLTNDPQQCLAASWKSFLAKRAS
jgi:hypothetical protein